MLTFHIKNFERFQHYKDRNPPWIKLYNELLDDYAFGELPDASKMHLIAIWLLASRSDNKIPYDPTWIGRRVNATSKVDLELLVRTGFIVPDQELHTTEQDASEPLAECLSRDRGETEGEREKYIAQKAPYPKSFEEVWEQFPRKTGKDAAFKAWRKTRDRVSHETLLAAVNAHAKQMLGKEKQFIPHPATWLNDGRWQDEDLQPSKPTIVSDNGRKYVKHGTDEWDDLAPGYKAKHGKSPPIDQHGGWWFDCSHDEAMAKERTA